MRISIIYKCIYQYYNYFKNLICLITIKILHKLILINIKWNYTCNSNQINKYNKKRNTNNKLNKKKNKLDIKNMKIKYQQEFMTVLHKTSHSIYKIFNSYHKKNQNIFIHRFSLEKALYQCG